MGRGFGQYIFYNPSCQFTRTLILFQDDQHGHARFDIGAGLSVHGVSSSIESRSRNSRDLLK
jgi:hypothetical protein